MLKIIFNPYLDGLLTGLLMVFLDRYGFGLGWVISIGLLLTVVYGIVNFILDKVTSPWTKLGKFLVDYFVTKLQKDDNGLHEDPNEINTVQKNQN